jgi:hypothetical protein
LFGLLLGAALGLRATALLMIGYAFLAAALRIPLLPVRGVGRAAAFTAGSLMRIAPAFLIAYVIMIAAWPWAALSPFNPVRAIFAFAHFHYPIRTLLGGEIYDMGTVPRRYVPTYLAIRLPLLIYAGACAALVHAAVAMAGDDRKTWRRPLEIALLSIAVCFPVACQVIARGPGFTGMRHFLFVVPPLAALAGIGFDAAISYARTRSRLVSSLIAAALAGALGWNLVLMARLHPYENLYYNALVGGLPGAAHRYAMDYWVSIMPEAVAALEAHLDRARRAGSPERVYDVGVCGEAFSFEHYADRRLRVTGAWKEADFFIAPTHMDCDRAVAGKPIFTITRLGVPLGVVKQVAPPN